MSDQSVSEELWNRWSTLRGQTLKNNLQVTVRGCEIMAMTEFANRLKAEGLREAAELCVGWDWSVGLLRDEILARADALNPLKETK